MQLYIHVQHILTSLILTPLTLVKSDRDAACEYETEGTLHSQTLGHSLDTVSVSIQAKSLHG